MEKDGDPDSWLVGQNGWQSGVDSEEYCKALATQTRLRELQNEMSYRHCQNQYPRCPYPTGMPQTRFSVGDTMPPFVSEKMPKRILGKAKKEQFEKERLEYELRLARAKIASMTLYRDDNENRHRRRSDDDLDHRNDLNNCESSTNQVKEMPDCVVCLDQKISHAFPCMHACVCGDCAGPLDKCPLCREPGKAKKVHFA